MDQKYLELFQSSKIFYIIKMLLAVQLNITRITKNSDRNSSGILNVYQAIPCNPFEMASLSTINNSALFPQSVSNQLKQVLSTGERQVKVFIQDSLLMHKTSITEKISKNKFPLLSIGSSNSTSINLGVRYMNKLSSAIEHGTARADELFREELYGIPHW